MTTDNFENFSAAAKTIGYHECLVREWAPSLVIDTHTHPFAVSAYVYRGEYWLTQGDEIKHLKAGDFFRLARDVPHAELYGAEGATVWVARAN